MLGRFYKHDLFSWKVVITIWQNTDAEKFEPNVLEELCSFTGFQEPE